MLIKDNKDYPTNSDNLDMKDYLVFNYYLEGMNVAIRNAGNNYESWSTTTGDKDKTCTEDISYDEEIIFYPSKCKPLDRPWINRETGDDIKGRATIISAQWIY